MDFSIIFIYNSKREEKGMHIAIDIDDTLTDTFEHLLPYIAEHYGLNEQELKGLTYQTLPIDWWENEEGFAKKYYDKIMPDAPMKAGAAHYVNKLHAEGHRITILTARTTRFYTDPYKTCKELLDKNGVCYDEIICSGDKGVACKEKGVDVLIDDWWMNLAAAREEGVKGLLFIGGGHKEDEEFEKVCTWEQVYKRLQEIAKEMKK